MKTIKSLMKDSPVVSGSVAFHCQQAIEKYFKAYLLEHDWELQKTHDLTKLYGEIKKLLDLQIDVKVLVKINDVYIETRYPDDYIEPTEEEAADFSKLSREVELKIKRELGIDISDTES
jgi:HEPN domain-containing protein